MPTVSFTVLLVVAVLVAIGLFVMSAALQPAGAGKVCRAAGCRHRNPPAAVFCARCGTKLTD